ncbi:MAG: FAD-binding oxidoreductase [Lentisphaeria bacterium]|nr:FAD-binding oxidoreductase [Candidatus Neomarinimicrobiota bacterium]MCF7841903.1 FAD-binding oxidoreductase [Lentisphaeria bacterium]
MDLIHDLEQLLEKNRVKARLIDRYSYARDASFYRLIPKVIVQPKSSDEVAALFDYARKTKIPLVFRAAGTSLSGQSITDGILVEINKYWRGYEIPDGAKAITLQPAVIGLHANNYLRRYGKKIGPDPASIAAAFVGGIVANNASGMCCGVKDNSYHTIQSLKMVLPNGLQLDSAHPDADAILREKAPAIHAGLLDLKNRIESNPKLRERIRDKYQRKNTMGYSLNAFLDFDKPIDILTHLLVGSEGTLGFISEITFNTLNDDPYKSTALLLFPDLFAAATAVTPLKTAGAEALELMDRASLRSVQDEPGMPSVLKTLPEPAAALLCEFQAPEHAALIEKVNAGRAALEKLKLLYPPDFTEDTKIREKYWKIRKGLFPAVGAVRKSGTTVIIEDICFRLKDLAPACVALQDLFAKHGYDNAIIFGHAKDGNLHFVITQEFADTAGIEQYRHFMNDVIEMTTGKYDGALKAEHGTGRNMAPFLETEWGSEAREIMLALKRLLDPDNILNPGVILNNDPEIYLKNIKPIPAVEAVVDQCVECGFCETWCPSADLTMTPRRRIATWREIQLLQKGSGTERAIARELMADYPYESVDTCAVDGLCALGCPVKIDTGKLTKHFREEYHSQRAEKIAQWTVDHFGSVVEGLRLGLTVATPFARIIGNNNAATVGRWLHNTSFSKIPAWNRFTPTGARLLPALPQTQAPSGTDTIVYFPACLSRGMGEIPHEKHEKSVPQALIDVVQAAGIEMRYPKQVNELCCGTPYSSKGYRNALIRMAERVTNALWESTEAGKYPVVMDTSPCTYRIKTYDEILYGEALERWQKLTILDVVAFLHDSVLPRVKITKVHGEAVLHPTCSTTKMELDEKFLALAEACVERAIIPEHHGCCGFAGDRGMLVPELTESATEREAELVRELTGDAGHYSISRTCEMGMSSATDRPYSSIIHLVHRAIFG